MLLNTPLGCRHNYWSWLGGYFEQRISYFFDNNINRISSHAHSNSTQLHSLTVSDGSLLGPLSSAFGSSLSTSLHSSNNVSHAPLSATSLSSFEEGSCSISADLENEEDVVMAQCSSPRGVEDFCLEDPALEFSPPRPRPRGWPRKNRGSKRATEGSPRRPRGRPKKSVCENAEGVPPLASPPSPSGPYFTRLKKVWMMGKYAEFPGSDEEAISGLAEFLRENGPVSS